MLIVCCDVNSSSKTLTNLTSRPIAAARSKLLTSTALSVIAKATATSLWVPKTQA